MQSQLPVCLVRQLSLPAGPIRRRFEAHLAELETDDPDEVWERWIERLFSEEPYRTRHAERMASPWLDQARYADTNGIHMDAGRQMWLWRDWVIEAIADDMPYDDFVRLQLAADLIKQAMIRIQGDLEKTGTGAMMLLQVHDELVLEVPRSSLDQAVRIVTEGMEGAMALKVPLVVDVHSGSNWAEAHG